MRICPACKAEKPNEAFYSSGSCRWCKECWRRRQAIRYENNKEAERKRCAESMKALRDRRMTEDAEGTRRAGREKGAAWLAARRGRRWEARVAWRAAHPDLAKLIDQELAARRQEMRQALYDRREEKRAAAKLRRVAREKEFRKTHRQEDAVRIKAWKKANPSRKLAHDRKREAVKLGCEARNEPAVFAFYEQVRTARRMRCYYCGKATRPADRHVDHVIPLSRGGPHAASNLACACAACNMSKGPKMPDAMGVLAF